MLLGVVRPHSPKRCRTTEPQTPYVRDEALGRLGELFAEDGTGDNPDELDYFEVRFNPAFASLRTDLVRAEVRALRRSSPLPDDEAIARRPDMVLHSLQHKRTAFS